VNDLPPFTPTSLDEEKEAIVSQLRNRARNLYETRELLCAEAVLVALNQGLGGGLTRNQAIAMAAPFCIAMGDSGCMCGALSGAVMASGLFLGNGSPYRYRLQMRCGSRKLHDDFKAVHGATCCRVLSRKVKDDKKAHFQQCADLTAHATEMAARLILEERPELVTQADKAFIGERQSKVMGMFLRLFHFFR
jgi:C_GCAxxG_C_C family probable redox protein